MKSAPELTSSSCVATYLRPRFGRRMRLQECFVVIPLDARNKPLRKPILVAIGSAASVDVHPRDVFRDAVKTNAVSIIIAHNHPSGVIEPSFDDISLTERIRKGGELLGIKVHDHLILTSNKSVYYSFAEHGYL